MMKFLIKIWTFLFIASSYAAPGLLFNIAQSGSPTTADVILCLNGKGPVSCQHYRIDAQELLIRSTLNHLYPFAGIKVITPNTQVTGCVPYPNGYCLFTTSNINPTLLTIVGSNPNTTNYLYLTNNTSMDISGYMRNLNSGSLTTLDTSPFTAGADPFGIALTPNGKFAYITNQTSNDIYIYEIDPNTGDLNQIGIKSTDQRPRGIAINKEGSFLYVVNRTSNTIQAFEIDSSGNLNLLNTQATGAGPDSLAISPDSKFVYVTNSNGNSISAYSVNNDGSLTPLSTYSQPGTFNPVGIAITPDGKFVYVIYQVPSVAKLFSIDPSGNLIYIADYSIGSLPSYLAITPDGKYMYVNDLNVITAREINSLTGALTPVPGSPFSVSSGSVFLQGIAISNDGKFVYVASGFQGKIFAFAISNTTGSLSAIAGSPFLAGADPRMIAIRN